MGNMTELITDLQYIKEEDEEINMSKRQTPPAEVTYVFNSLEYKNIWKILIFSLRICCKRTLTPPLNFNS